MIYIMIYHFCKKEWKLKNVTSLYVICMIKIIAIYRRILGKQALKHGLVF